MILYGHSTRTALPDESKFRPTAEQLANLDLTGGLNSQEGDHVLASTYQTASGDGGSTLVSLLNTK